MKFEAMELEVLVEEANKHTGELQQRHLSVARRNVIWEAICEKVNAVSKTRRSANEIKRRWQDICRRTKGKLSFNKTSANKTGGGPAEEIPLSPTEQQIQVTFCDEQIVGIEGYDSLDPNIANQGRPIVTQTHISYIGHI